MNIGIFSSFFLNLLIYIIIVTKERPEDVQHRETEKFKSAQYERIKKQRKGENAYVTLHTSMGDLNLELYPYYTPKTCDNFLTLCERGYYNNVKFHRLIKGFMVSTVLHRFSNPLIIDTRR